MGEDPVDDADILDHGDTFHLDAALGAEKGVDLEDPAQQTCPASTAGPGGRGFGVDSGGGADFGGRVTGAARLALPPRPIAPSPGGIPSEVTDEVLARSRDLRAQPEDEFEVVELEGALPGARVVGRLDEDLALVLALDRVQVQGSAGDVPGDVLLPLVVAGSDGLAGPHAEAGVFPGQLHLLGVFSQALGLAQAGKDTASEQLGDGRDVPASDSLEGRGRTARVVEHALGDQGVDVGVEVGGPNREPATEGLQ